MEIFTNKSQRCEVWHDSQRCQLKGAALSTSSARIGNVYVKHINARLANESDWIPENSDSLLPAEAFDLWV